MKVVTALTALLLAASASIAGAQSGLNLYWNGCTKDPDHTMRMRFACDANTGPAFEAFASVVVPSDMPAFVAASCAVDVCVPVERLPAWWQTWSGGCRENAIRMSFDPADITTNCADLWDGVRRTSVFAVQYPSPVFGYSGANTIRIKGGAALPAGSEFLIEADGETEFAVARITLSRAKSTADGACAGCDLDAVLMFVECQLQQPAPLPSYTVTTPFVGNLLDWQGGANYFLCLQTSTRNRTWGSVKGMYR